MYMKQMDFLFLADSQLSALEPNIVYVEYRIM